MNEATALQTLMDGLRSADPVLRRQSALKLGMMHNPVIVSDLIRAADDADSTVRALLASALATIGNPALERLRHALHDENPLIRQTAVSALRHMNQPEVVPDLIPLLDDPDPIVQATVADTLRIYRTEDAQAALKKWDLRL